MAVSRIFRSTAVIFLPLTRVLGAGGWNQRRARVIRGSSFLTVNFKNSSLRMSQQCKQYEINHWFLCLVILTTKICTRDSELNIQY